MSDVAFDLVLPPEPSQNTAIRDAFDYNVAFNLAFVGVGQAGGRLARAFHKLGYARVCAVNTTVADLQLLQLPDEKKLDLGNARGAGKDPKQAAAIFETKQEELFDLLSRNWGPAVDCAMVCFAAAGGTGAGGYAATVAAAQRFMQHHNRPVRVGALVALPRIDEGQQHNRNAVNTARALMTAGLSPIILIDNQRIGELYNPAQSAVHDVENDSTANLLHVFNRLAGTASDDTSFDRAEFAKLLDSGLIAFAADTVRQWAAGADISTPIRERLQQNALAAVDLKTARTAGLLYVLDGAARDVPAANLGHGTAMFTRMVADGAVVFTAVYNGRPDGPGGIKVLAMLGGLDWPQRRLAQLAAAAGVSPLSPPDA